LMKKSKAGFVSVYLCLFFLTLVSAALLVIGGVRQSVLHSNVEALSRLWGQSILAEYDLNLQERYGLFGFYGYPAMVTEKLEFYAGDTFKQMDKRQRPSWKIQSCSLYPYTLRNTDVFKTQMINAGKTSAVKKTMKYMKDIVPVTQSNGTNVKNLFAQLPSEGRKNSFNLSVVTDLLQNHTSLKKIVKKGSDRYFEQQYIFSHFRHRNTEGKDETGTQDSYFLQEIEYLICGKQTDKGNETGIKSRIIAVREVLNLMYLNQNEKTRYEALAIAEVLTPGAAAAVTQQTLLSMWAMAESVNDYRLLVNGHQIPLMKTESTWATDLESILENETEGYIYTGKEEGESYIDYLKLFLYAVDDQLRVLRMMDLIQINMRSYYYDEFLLSDYYGGLGFNLQVQGKDHKVEMYYE